MYGLTFGVSLPLLAGSAAVIGIGLARLRKNSVDAGKMVKTGFGILLLTVMVSAIVFVLS